MLTTMPTARLTTALGGFLAQVRTLEGSLARTGDIPLTENPLWIPYGLRPPKGVVQAWGMRAKFDRRGHLTLVPDCASRNAQLGVSQERQRLFDRFVETVGIPRIQERVRILQPTDDREVQSTLGRYCIRANPKASRGYLYLGAHELPFGHPPLQTSGGVTTREGVAR